MLEIILDVVAVDDSLLVEVDGAEVLSVVDVEEDDQKNQLLLLVAVSFLLAKDLVSSGDVSWPSPPPSGSSISAGTASFWICLDLLCF